MADHPTFGRVDYLAPARAFDAAKLGARGDLGDVAFGPALKDPYLTNPITRASETMAELSAVRSAPQLMAAE